MIIKKPICLWIISLLFVFLIIIQYDNLYSQEWEMCPIYGYGYVSVSSVNSDILFASRFSRTFRSRDGGENWSEIPLERPIYSSILAYDVEDSATIFALMVGDSGEKWLSRSTDLGTAWEYTFLIPDDHWVIDFYQCKHFPNTFYFTFGTRPTRRNELWKSEDRGFTWTCVDDDWLKQLLGINPDNPEVIYVIRGVGVEDRMAISRSPDGGLSFEDLDTVDNDNNIKMMVDEHDSIHFFMWNLDSIYESIGDVVEMNYVGFYPCSIFLSHTKLYFSPSNMNVFYSHIDYGPPTIWKTTNKGRNWEELSSVPFAPMAIVLDPTNENVIYGYGEYCGGIIKSTDGGENWAIKSKGLSNGFIPSIYISNLEPNNLYTINHKVPFRSSDYGASWIICAGDLVFLRNVVATNRETIIANPFNFEEIYIGCSAHTFGIAKSTNAGIDWYWADFLSPIINVLSMLISVYEPLEIYAGRNERRGIYKSVDYGATWFSTPLDSVTCFVLKESYTTPGKIWAGCEEGFFRTTDGGETWDCIIESLRTTSISMERNNDSIIYICGQTLRCGELIESYLLKTNNDGVSWDTLHVPVDSFYYKLVAVDPNYPQRVFTAGHYIKHDCPTPVCSTTTVFGSNDSGRTWHDIGPSFKNGNVAYNALGDGILLTNDVFTISSDSRYLFLGTLWYGLWRYELPDISINENIDKPGQYVLLKNYPNPFNESTTFVLDFRSVAAAKLPSPNKTSLKIYDILGKEVIDLTPKLPDRITPNSTVKIMWDGKNNRQDELSSGIYFAKLSFGDSEKIIKLLMIK